MLDSAAFHTSPDAAKVVSDTIRVENYAKINLTVNMCAQKAEAQLQSMMYNSTV